MTGPSEIETLTIWFDADCGLCAALRAWLERQPKFVSIEFRAAQRPGTCPLEPQQLLDELTVVANTGAIWRGANAWLVCLWALEEYRGWSVSLASPLLLPFARRLFRWVSDNRYRLGRSDPRRAFVPDDQPRADG